MTQLPPLDELRLPPSETEPTTVRGLLGNAGLQLGEIEGLVDNLRVSLGHPSPPAEAVAELTPDDIPSFVSTCVRRLETIQMNLRLIKEILG